MTDAYLDGLPALKTPKTRDLLLIRHGETDWNVEWRIQGHRPVPLNELGREQIAWCAEAIADSIGDRGPAELTLWHSPIARAAESAEIIVEGLKARGVEPMANSFVREGLSEFDMGDFTGRTMAELRRDPQWRACMADPVNAEFPGGESMATIRTRAWGTLCEIAAEAPGDIAVVVSHGGIIRTLFAMLLGLSVEHVYTVRVVNGGMLHLRLLPPQGIKILAVNQTAGLAPLFV